MTLPIHESGTRSDEPSRLRDRSGKGGSAKFGFVVAWLVLTAVVEGLAAWNLPSIGGGLDPPVGAVVVLAATSYALGGWLLWRPGGARRSGRRFRILLTLCCLAIGLIVLDIIVSTSVVLPETLLVLGIPLVLLSWYVVYRFVSGPPAKEQPVVPWRQGSIIAMGVASLLLGLAAGLFTYYWALPLHVRSWNADLMRLVTCTEHPTRTCPRGATVDVPGLGVISRSGVYYAHGAGLPSAVSITAGCTTCAIGANGRGYIYQPGATLRSFDFQELFVRHLWGPWWEFSSSPIGGYSYIDGP